MPSFSSLFLPFVFSTIGTGYFIYGKKQGDMICLAAGIGLVLYPLFISGLLLGTLIGLALMAGPFVANRYLA